MNFAPLAARSVVWRSPVFLVLSVCLWAGTAAFAQTNFAVLATDGAWTWYNDPRAIFHQGRLYFGYVRADGKTALGVFTPSTGVASNLWVSGFTQVDDHNNPGLLAKSDGTLLAIYARHGTDQWFAWRRSVTNDPHTSTGWAPEQQIPNSGAGITYANPFQLSAEGGLIYNFCRNTNYNPTFFTSTNGGNSWSGPRHFIRTGTGGTRPYVKYASDHTQRIDFLYTDGHPRDVNNSLYHLYYQGGAFYRSDGILLKSLAALPLEHDSGERGSVIYQYSAAPQSNPDEWIPTGRAWCWEIANDTNGAPVAVFTVQRDDVTGTGWNHDRIYYYYARWTGTNWQKRFIAHAGRPLYAAEDDYAGGICLDPQNPSVIYLSSNAQNPFDLSTTTNVPLSASGRYELWRGVTSDGGLTFAWTAMTTNSSADNLRPYVPRRNGGEPSVLWFRGTYTTYTTYNCQIVGLFTTPIPPPPFTPAHTYVDATSGPGGNTTLANGAVFTPPLNGTTGLDNLWEERTVFGSHGNIFEAGGEVAEDAPELRTTLTGLVPGARYAVFVHFWDATGTTENWHIRAGFTANPGANPAFSAADATGIAGATAAGTASSLNYLAAPTLFTEANRVLLAGLVGTHSADGGGQLNVFLDDLPSPIGANRRTWYDGLSYLPAPEAAPPALTSNRVGDTVVLSWPATHVGWVLQLQTNLPSAGIDSRWITLPASYRTNQWVVSPALPSAFYRLVRP